MRNSDVFRFKLRKFDIFRSLHFKCENIKLLFCYFSSYIHASYPLYFFDLSVLSLLIKIRISESFIIVFIPVVGSRKLSAKSNIFEIWNRS